MDDVGAEIEEGVRNGGEASKWRGFERRIVDQQEVASTSIVQLDEL